MKKLIFFFVISVTALQAQITPDPNTNSGTTPVPINPGQTTQPYNGTNPSGVPNQINSYSPATTPMPGSNYQPTVQPMPVTPSTPTQPGGNPSKPFNNINRLYQDPVRTPSNPKQVDPVRHADGSTGKHHKPKKAMSGKTFAHNKTHVKKSKGNNSSNSEKTRAPETTR